MRKSLWALLFLLPNSAWTDDSRAEKRAIERIKGEIHFARARHPSFDLYRTPALRYAQQHLDLTIEEAFCSVTRAPTCEKLLELLPPSLPAGAVPFLEEQDDGSLVEMRDKETGAPVFDVDGTRYTAFGPVGEKAPPTEEPGNHPSASESLDARLPVVRSRAKPPLIPFFAPTQPWFNAYGYGLHSDATGQPFTFKTQDGLDAFGPVRLNGYGLGVHMDQYGRPVHAVPR